VLDGARTNWTVTPSCEQPGCERDRSCRLWTPSRAGARLSRVDLDDAWSGGKRASTAGRVRCPRWPRHLGNGISKQALCCSLACPDYGDLCALHRAGEVPSAHGGGSVSGIRPSVPVSHPRRPILANPLFENFALNRAPLLVGPGVTSDRRRRSTSFFPTDSGRRRLIWALGTDPSRLQYGAHIGRRSQSRQADEPLRRRAVPP